jgi:hypothetical protein
VDGSLRDTWWWSEEGRQIPWGESRRGFQRQYQKFYWRRLSCRAWQSILETARLFCVQWMQKGEELGQESWGWKDDRGLYAFHV